MQEGILTPSNWKQTLLGWLASFLVGGGIVKVYITWLNRNKPAAEVHVAEATATEITVRTGSTAGDAIIRFMGRLEQAQASIDRLRVERDAWEDEYGKVFDEKSRLARENGRLQGEMKLYMEEVKQMRITLESNNLNYDNTQDISIQTEPG